jgi:hypothetical protein
VNSDDNIADLFSKNVSKEITLSMQINSWEEVTIQTFKY